MSCNSIILGNIVGPRGAGRALRVRTIGTSPQPKNPYHFQTFWRDISAALMSQTCAFKCQKFTFKLHDMLNGLSIRSDRSALHTDVIFSSKRLKMVWIQRLEGSEAPEGSSIVPPSFKLEERPGLRRRQQNLFLQEECYGMRG
jgi:hypothetical protein